jgi:squalene-hopene/tetraprenyl-beta-curcumene cyclase
MVRKWLCSVALLAMAGSACAADVDAATATAAAKKAVAFLEGQQAENGVFGKAKPDGLPGVVGLAIKAIASSPDKPRENNNPALAKAGKYLAGLQQANGAIAIPQFGNENYNTSIAVIALVSLENPAYKDVLEKAQAFILTCQKGEDAGPDKEGGFAYNKESQKPDNSNTGFSLEALKALGLKEDSPAWKNAVKFIKRSQDNAETNDLPVMKEGDNTGGFIYAPGVADDFGSVVSKRTGKSVPKPYGNMTYQAIKGLLYAKVDKNDPSLQAAYKWVKNNYSVTENPGGKGTMGYYYYVLAFTKAFSAMGEKEFETADGKKVNWAKDMAAQLLKLQQADGSFVNADKEWMEGDPILSTSYALDALNLCINAMK